jgi:hypothetical protein
MPSSSARTLTSLPGFMMLSGSSALDPAHQIDLDRRFVMDDLVAFQAADAVARR